MAAKLIAEAGPDKGLLLSLEGNDRWVIGRDPDTCQLLIEDPLVSRKHLVCHLTTFGLIVENLSITNPIEINNEVIKEPYLLQNGDAVKIGSNVFRFYDETSTDKKINFNQQKQQTAISPQPESKEQYPMKSSLSEKNSPQTALPEERETRHDTIFEEETSDKHQLAEINFGLLETGRWLLKVIRGPNNGAEFSMQAGFSYLIGTDPNSCDIVFHDTSVSRQHVRIVVAQDDTLTIEDLNSRNGTNIDGEPIKGRVSLTPNTLISIGTTAFVVFDREGEMQTIISPLMPSIVKVLQNEEAKEKAPLQPSLPIEEEEVTKEKETPRANTLGALILIGILSGLFILIGLGTSTLFESQPVSNLPIIDPLNELDTTLRPFPSVKYNFNKNTGYLQLVGHVLTVTDRSQLLYELKGLKFIKGLDDSGIVIDEYVWRESNQIIEKNPDWKGITITATSPGQFIVFGYLKTHQQADRLYEYLSTNFPYPNLLDKRVVVDEEIMTSINNLLHSRGFTNVKARLENGEVSLIGGIPKGKSQSLVDLVASIKEIRGVRNVRNRTVEQAPEQSMINISDRYQVSGLSSHKGRLSIVINGRILMEGDSLDGMTITKIQANTVILEKGGTSYRIDFSR